MAVNTALWLKTHGLGDYQHAYWMLSTAMNLSLRLAKIGRRPLAWFYPVAPLSLKLKVFSSYLASISSMLAQPLSQPVYLDLQKPSQMLAWLVERLGDGTHICFTCYASSAARICAVAMEKGVALDGVCFVNFGEPFTDAKRAILEAVGARGLTSYGCTEAGTIGFSCANPLESDDAHLFTDCFAAIQHPCPVAETGWAVRPFLLTSLLSSAPKVLLNTEPGDHGVLEQRRCGCGLEAVGLYEHLAGIRSYEKLSGEGMTFVRTDLLRVVEQILPERFGGAMTDYQVLEEEGENGILRLLLFVSPELGALDEDEVRETFLSAVEQNGGYARIGIGMWRRAGTLEIRRQRPIATKSGKILPFHLVKVAGRE